MTISNNEQSPEEKTYNKHTQPKGSCLGIVNTPTSYTEVVKSINDYWRKRLSLIPPQIPVLEEFQPPEPRKKRALPKPTHRRVLSTELPSTDDFELNIDLSLDPRIRKRDPHAIPDLAYTVTSTTVAEEDDDNSTIYSDARPADYINIAANLRDMAASQSLPVPDIYIRRIEDMVLTFAQLSYSTSYAQATLIMTSYFRTFGNASFMSQVQDCLARLFTSNEPQFGESPGETALNHLSQNDKPLYTPVKQPIWLTHLRDWRTNWSSLIASPIFAKISELMSLCVSIGLCEASALTFSMAGYNMFSVKVKPRHASAFDLLNAALDTVVYFIETGHRAFATGSLQCLLYDDNEWMDFDDRCSAARKGREYARIGALERYTGWTHATFSLFISETYEIGKKLTRGTRDSALKAVLRSRMTELDKIEAEMVTSRLGGDLRIAPFMTSFYGESSQGKSTIANYALRILLGCNGFPNSSEYITVLNEKDKYWSGWNSHTVGCVLDDIGNIKAEYSQSPAAEMILHLNNNTPCYAQQAEAERKGKIPVEPMVVVITTNVKDLGATTFSNEPVSIVRRCDIHVNVRARPEFCTNGFLDERKVNAHYEAIDPNNTDPLRDVWSFDAQIAVPVKQIVKGKSPAIGWELVKVENRLYQDINAKELILLLVGMSQEHFVSQRRIVHRATDPKFAITFCPACTHPTQFCVCACGKLDMSSVSNTNSSNPVPPVPPSSPPSPPKGGGPDPPPNGGGADDDDDDDDLPNLRSRKDIENDSDDEDEDDADILDILDALDPVPDKLAVIRASRPKPSKRTPLVRPKKPRAPHFGMELTTAFIRSATTGYAAALAKKYVSVEHKFDRITTSTLATLCNHMELSPVLVWTNWIPDHILAHEYCQTFVLHMEDEMIYSYVMTQWMRVLALWVFFVYCHVTEFVPHTNWLCAIYVLHYYLKLSLVLQPNWQRLVVTITIITYALAGFRMPRFDKKGNLEMIPIGFWVPQWIFMSAMVIAVWICSLQWCANIRHCRQRVFELIVARRGALPELAKDIRERYSKMILGGVAGILALCALCKCLSLLRVTADPQSKLAPEDYSEVKERDKEVNPWADRVVPLPLPVDHKCKTTTLDQSTTLAFNNLCYMVLKIDGKDYGCNAWFPASNFCVVPNHIWADRIEMEAHFIRREPGIVGANFRALLSKSHCVPMPDQPDFCGVWIPNGGDWRDITHLLPEELPVNGWGPMAQMVYKDSEGVRRDIRMSKVKFGKVSHSKATFFGAEYMLDINSFPGLCMAPILSMSTSPSIIGFHLGGYSGTPDGICGTFTRSQIESVRNALQAKRSVLLTPSSGTLETTQYDVQWFTGADVHPKSPVNYLTSGATCDFYGQTIGRATNRSDVVDTLISKDVAEVMGAENKWGKPAFHLGKHWSASLEASTHCSIGIEGVLLDHAVDDYLQPIIDLMMQEEFAALRAEIKPLTRMQTLCGIDGCRFIDKMKPDTALGFPETGPKSKMIELLDPLDFPEFACPAAIHTKYWDEFERCKLEYLEGRRVYYLFKACAKDEATPKDKEKVRIFQAAPMVAQLAIRKYFLPVVRLLSVVPLLSECAVGINSEGPEWEELHKYVNKFGADRILAGDYSKYDLRMPSQLTLVAFNILIEIAKASGNYTEEDLTIMRGIAADVCYPLMAYNGDLIQHKGSNPSGHNLTVYINSIVNSLLFRAAVYLICSVPKIQAVGGFRKMCALTTYGDDAKSSVKAGFDEFNFNSYSKFLADRDMKFTLPDKKEVENPPPYLHDADADFLKRKSVWNEEVGMHFGPLDEDSIFKQLHCVMQSNVLSPIEQCVLNINNSARDFFYHGRDTYDKRRAELLEVAKRHNIEHECGDIHVSYDLRMARWKEKYLSDET
ncbi:nonstructural protein [Antarctic picorna-like virus 2]|uniref:nonstructural protein n=1 Tax=Antarctic picorna-like virus 2 TaxID=1648482 RepID=UPI00067A6507|nr:nonstructural protein [Antarctic picorna-like virus 2]AKG93962.1 nonstructural protein [Antarctic picorna-like virus 2]